MQSKLASGSLCRPAGARRLSNLGLDAGLCVLAGLYCAIAGCLAVGLYELMQPTRLRNPGMSAGDLSSGNIAFVPAIEGASAAKSPANGVDAFAFAIAPEVKAKDDASKQPTNGKKSGHATHMLDMKRARRVQPKGRDPMMGHAAQPNFDGYRPWGNYQALGNYRPFGNYQTLSNHQSLSGYQGRR